MHNVMTMHKPQVWSLSYDADYVLQHTKIPTNPENTPDIIGWCGPSRSGTTALLFLLAGHPNVDRTYFQPQKTLMRDGGPDFTLFEEDELVCMKEVFWSIEPEDPHDPVDLLLKAGVPADKITWVVLLRDPLQVFASWIYFDKDIDPTLLYYWQRHSIALFNKYRDLGIKVAPFVYELLEGKEEKALKALLNKVGLSIDGFKMSFDHRAINSKSVPGQSADEEYFRKLVKATLEKEKFMYTRNSYPLSKELSEEVQKLCSADYARFLKLAKEELAL